MNNNYYNPYPRPYCEMPKKQCTMCSAQNTTDGTAMRKSGCERRMENPIPENAVYAMAYVPFQTDIECYDCICALKNGTLFPSLNKPFTGVCRYE